MSAETMRALAHLPSASVGSMDGDDLMRTQRRLRSLLLESGAQVDHAAQELAARMLLYLDQPDRCWTIATEWLIGAVDVERVDGGWSTPVDETYKAGQFEATREPGMESIQDLVVSSSHRTLRTIWSSPGPVVHEDMARTSLFDDGLRQYFLRRGIHTKMTAALAFRGCPVGLLCVDRMSSVRRWSQSQYECFAAVTQNVMPPILAEARRLSRGRVPMPSDERDGNSADTSVALDRLTPAELRICRLVAQGLSYKEICRLINRSFSTVDHQLRSVRRKLGVASTAKLITLLAAEHSALSRGALPAP
jgi:DNA-binding CsgD family transcriptional regulator